MKFSKIWFLLWRSRKAREDLAIVYERLERLKADIRVGCLVEKKWRFSQTTERGEGNSQVGQGVSTPTRRTGELAGD